MDVNNFVYNQLSDLSLQTQFSGLNSQMGKNINNNNVNSVNTNNIKKDIPLKRNSDANLIRINENVKK